MSKLILDNVSYMYSKGTPFCKSALKNISVEFSENKITGLIGHTGSGKSTLAQIICGLIKPDSGKVYLDGKDIFQDAKSTVEARVSVGLVFQYPEYQLFEETVWKDIAFGPKNLKKSPEEISRLISESADFVGLDRELLNKSPFELSGGQKRRAAIAGILAMDTSVIVLDEPCAGLDPSGREDLFGRLKNYQKEKNKTLIIISHSMEDMAKYADDILIMKDGSVFNSDSVDNIFSNPKLIEDSGLDLPSITKLMIKLKMGGMPIDTSIHTVSDAYFHLYSVLKGGSGNAE